MGDVEAPKTDGETDKASLTEDPKVGLLSWCSRFSGHRCTSIVQRCPAVWLEMRIGVGLSNSTTAIAPAASLAPPPPPPRPSSLPPLFIRPPVSPWLQEAMRQAIRKRHRNYLVGFLVMIFFILIISFCAFRQTKISWRCAA